MAADPDASRVDVDASIVFRHPYRTMVLLTFIVGGLDAVGIDQFGVFTANQAGNLVLVWTFLGTDPASAALAAASLLGCVLGVACVVSLRHVWGWLAGSAGSRALLVAAACLIVVAAFVGDDVRRVTIGGSDPWWPEALSISLISFSVAVLGVVFVSGGGHRAPVLASTNALVDAVRYGTASGLSPRSPDWARMARRAGAFPLAWTLGAATAALLPVGRLVIVVGAAALVVAVALLARRVTEADPSTPPTV